MKISLFLKLNIIATLTFSAITLSKPTSATDFDEATVDQSKFIAVAVPYNYQRFRLAIIEQVPGERPCWRESGSNPVTVDLLLLNFDHTNSCRKAVDTNGYSLRINGKDDKVAYVLNLFANNGEIQLVADHRDPQKPDLIVGRTNGIQEAPLKINLDPSWQFSKRVYNGNPIQHIYLSNNSNPQAIDNVATVPPNTSSQSTPPTTATSQPNQSAPAITQPTPNSIPSVEVVQGIVSSIMTPLTEAVYQTYNSLFTSPTNNGQPQANAGCQGAASGKAIWSEQEIAISGDGIIQLNDGRQLDIKPTLNSNGINPSNFLGGQNAAQLDFDGDGETEELKIIRPPQPCNASSN